MSLNQPDPAAAIDAASRLYAIFASTKRLCMKVDTYFRVYEQVLQRFVDRSVVFVEVGVLHGGSLFMWREYLGAHARVIGVDLNPQARQWEREGFEIHIGDQSDPAFWDAFYRAVGPVDVLRDDGGHTNSQQIVTAVKGFEHVRDGGLVIVEDVHASFIPFRVINANNVATTSARRRSWRDMLVGRDTSKRRGSCCARPRRPRS